LILICPFEPQPKYVTLLGMDSIGDLLGRYQPQQPDEAMLVKQFIAEKFNAPSSVAVRDTTITITVGSASLANTLRLRTNAIKKTANTQKKIIFRIG
jgi:hypothetical protein